MSAVGDFLAWPWLIVSSSGSEGVGIFQCSKSMLTSPIKNEEVFQHPRHTSHKDSPLVPLVLPSDSL